MKAKFVNEDLSDLFKPKTFPPKKQKFFDGVRELKNLGFIVNTHLTSSKILYIYVYGDVILEKDGADVYERKYLAIKYDVQKSIWTLRPNNVEDRLETPDWDIALKSLLNYFYPDIEIEINGAKNRLKQLKEIKSLLTN